MNKTVTSIRIQPRDRRLVRDVFLHKLATRDHLLGLGYFDSIPRCNQRLKQLVAAGWLRRLMSINYMSSSQYCYAAGRRAAHMLSAELDIPPEEIQRGCQPHEGPLLVEHALRTLDLRVQLLRDAIRAGYTVQSWRSEAECLHDYRFRRSEHAPWQRVIIKPDGLFALDQGLARDYFVEVDLGHVALPRFAAKLRRYEHYLRSGAFAEAYGSRHFRVLTVTTGPRRQSHLTNLPCRAGMHLVTTWRCLQSASIFDSVWSTAFNDRIRFWHSDEAMKGGRP